MVAKILFCFALFVASVAGFQLSVSQNSFNIYKSSSRNPTLRGNSLDFSRKSENRANPALLRSAANSAILETIFQIENIYPLPFWLLMIFAPNSKITKKIMGNYAIFVPLAALYIWQVVVGLTSPGGAEIFMGPITLAAISKAFSMTSTAAAAWTHFLAFDLFVGRWILFDSIRNRVFAAHSIVMAFFFGPAGLLSHLVTREIARGGRPRDAVTEAAAAAGNLLDDDEALLRLLDDD